MKAISSGKEGRAEIQHWGRIYVPDVYPMAEEGRQVRVLGRPTANTPPGCRDREDGRGGAAAGGVAHEIINPLAGILTLPS
jgi:hypothetical protein